MGSMKIPISCPVFGEEEEAALLRTFRTGHWAAGIEVSRLEEELAASIGAKHAIAVANGSLALEAALLALGIGRGCEVVTTPLSFFATTEAIIRVGATPVFADVDPDTYNLAPTSVEEVLTSRTAALLPVHLFGRPCPMDELDAIAARNGLVVLQDACQAIGARYQGRYIGANGTSCFSFYGSKNVTCGEGGAVLTNDEAVADRIRSLRSHGASKDAYLHESVGTNLRMTDLQAAILRVQLQRLPSITGSRQDNSRTLSNHLCNERNIRLPIADDRIFLSSWHQYTIRVPRHRRSAIIEEMRRGGIESRVYYPKLIPTLPAMASMSPLQRTGCLNHAERAVTEVLSLPVHPRVSRNDIEYMAGRLSKALL
jgi:dTDP-4-amino-4,6-dideoxygalactose transaminase